MHRSDHTPQVSVERQKRWNAGLLAFTLLYTVLAGAVRKWLLIGGITSNILLLGQILLPWIFFFLAAGRCKKYLPVLLVLGGVLTIMAFNPLNQSIFHGVFGLLLHLGFWLIGFHYLENRHLYPWDRLLGLLLFIFAVEVVLGVIQYNLPRTHFINRYATEGATSIAFVGEAARVTGTFSYVAGYTSWLVLVNLWVWSLALLRKNLGLIILLIGLSLLASLISGARMTLALTALFGLISYSYLAKKISVHRTIAVLLLAISSVALVYRESVFVQEAWKNFYSRIEDGLRDKEYGRRTVGILEEVVNYKGDYPVFGSGLGGTYQGARLIWGESYYLKKYGGYEEEPERIVLEGGFVLLAMRAGLLLVFLFALHIPLIYKLFFFVFILFFTQNIFNAYNIIFISFGLSLLDWSYHRLKHSAG